MKRFFRLAATAAATFAAAGMVNAQVACTVAGPQTPRDISSTAGSNAISWPFAPAASELNLCNIHTHTNAEHKGPGFMVAAGDGEHGGFKCNETASLTPEELAEVHGGAHGVKPGETIEVHWVHTSCAAAVPGEGLGACVPEGCETPQLRVETQVFLVVNDPSALNFNDFMYEDGHMMGGMYQATALPTGTGDPVVFLGSTTGPSYDSDQKCSPANVTWSVRPHCAKVDAGSVNAWFSSKNVFEEEDSHRVRQLVTNPALLAPIN